MLLAACAGEPPLAELETARAAVAQAQPEGARYASQQLARAQQKLARAEAAMAHYDYDDARLFAEQAAADARVAQAMSDSVSMQTAAAEANQAIRALRDELERRSPR